MVATTGHVPENFYDLLGVDDDASQEELKRAFRRQVRRYHPDVSDSPDATERFRACKRAYETLSDPSERAAYDRLGHVAYVEQRLGESPEATDAAPTSTTPGRSGARRASGDARSAERTAAGESPGSAGGGSGTARAGGVGSAGRAGSERGSADGGATGRGAAGGWGRGGTATGRPGAATVGAAAERSEHERAHVRRQMHRRRVVSRFGEPVLAVATLNAFAIYAIGLLAFYRAQQSTLDALVASVVGAPGGAAETLAGASALTRGLQFAGASAEAHTLGLCLPVGAALVPVTLFATVHRLPAPWRHPGWWLLPVLGAGPAAALVVEIVAPAAVAAGTVTAVGYVGAVTLALVGWVGLLLSRL